jgi:hypothetical protein
MRWWTNRSGLSEVSIIAVLLLLMMLMGITVRRVLHPLRNDWHGLMSHLRHLHWHLHLTVCSVGDPLHVHHTVIRRHVRHVIALLDWYPLALGRI